MKKMNKKIGIGFATGRKHFQRVLKTNIYNWLDGGLTTNEALQINPIIAYDLNFENTNISDFTNISKEIADLVDDIFILDKDSVKKETDIIVRENIIDEAGIRLIFNDGYAGKRNAILYTAIKNKMDYLLFLDDDEYPVAVTNTRSIAVWSGQQVLTEHLKYISRADITNGYHCGYISPIPQVCFNDLMSEADFRQFIEAISNDIINWDTIRSVMKNGGVTYADTNILIEKAVEEVAEDNHAKFITGSNLCINLTDLERISPFYNPPGARGEDTFLSTCLSKKRVLRIPCYTFHDGFSTYNHLMDGVLPIKLESIQADSEQVVDRFYNACIGWIRYKPLFLYITQREDYENKIEEIHFALSTTLPKVSAYFRNEKFMNILDELESYHSNVKVHYQQFEDTQKAWKKIMDSLGKAA